MERLKKLECQRQPLISTSSRVLHIDALESVSVGLSGEVCVVVTDVEHCGRVPEGSGRLAASPADLSSSVVTATTAASTSILSRAWSRHPIQEEEGEGVPGLLGCTPTGSRVNVTSSTWQETGTFWLLPHRLHPDHAPKHAISHLPTQVSNKLRLSARRGWVGGPRLWMVLLGVACREWEALWSLGSIDWGREERGEEWGAGLLSTQYCVFVPRNLCHLPELLVVVLMQLVLVVQLVLVEVAVKPLPGRSSSPDAAT
ncbi:hypothetical protein CRUP_009545 [Coryphaenoides rupestris]|nr:hypothetical protein CRUP_009545 [Coryphaenoides rupestris]